MKAAAALLTLALVASGCRPMHVVPSDSLSLSEANAKLKDEDATLILRDERRALAFDVQIGPDETSWFDMGSWERRSFPNEDILRIRVEQPARGHVKKLLYGGAAILSASTMTPWYGFVFGYVPLIWFVIGPPTMFNDADVFEIEPAHRAGAPDSTDAPYSLPP